MITAVAGHTVELIVTEANSGLEPDLASALQASGVRVSPWSSASSTRCRPRHEVPDRIDVRALAALARVLVSYPSMASSSRPHEFDSFTRRSVLLRERTFKTCHYNSANCSGAAGFSTPDA